MPTNWKLIREIMNETISACEAMDALEITEKEKDNPEIRWGDFDSGVAVGDFLNRFQAYPAGAQGDIVCLRSELEIEGTTVCPELGKALIHTAAACAEAVGVLDVDLEKEAPDFNSHCGSAGKSIRSQLEGIPKIQKNWMVHEVTNAITKHRGKNG